MTANRTVKGTFSKLSFWLKYPVNKATSHISDQSTGPLNKTPNHKNIALLVDLSVFTFKSNVTHETSSVRTTVSLPALPCADMESLNRGEQQQRPPKDTEMTSRQAQHEKEELRWRSVAKWHCRVKQEEAA